MRKFIFIFLCFVVIAAGAQTSKKNGRQELFNGKDLSGWDTYIGRKFDSTINKRTGEPLGLNNDPDRVFSVANEDGKPAVRISGQHFGGISTHGEFENFHLVLEFKWGKKRWHPKRDEKRDSGLLYHAVGAHGADGGSWMRSQEFQVQEGDCGDYWGVSGGVFDIPAAKNKDGNYVYDPSAPLLMFSEGSAQGRHCIKNPDAEKPSGEWNVLEVYCYGDTAVHIMNGKVIMILYKSRQTDNGNETPLKKGKIQIQSEGAEIFYRNISVEAIRAIPKNILAKK
jgi:hypothetical protein